MAKKAQAKKPRIKTVEDDLSAAAQADAKKDLAESAAAIRELRGEESESENKSTSFPFGANAMAAKTSTNKKKTTKKATGGKSGSDKVRDYFKKHGTGDDVKNSAVSKATKVSQSQVSNIRKEFTGGTKKSKGGRPKATAATNTNGHSAAEFVKTAFGMGLDKAIDTLQAIKKAIG